MIQCKCGSYAINHHLHGRDGSEPELCDVCYWREKHDLIVKLIEEINREALSQYLLTLAMLHVVKPTESRAIEDKK